MDKHVYEIEKTPDKGWLLWKDDTHSHCGFATPIPVVNQFGNPVLYRHPCCSACPMATVENVDEGGKLKYTTCCSGKEITFEVTTRGIDQSSIIQN